MPRHILIKLKKIKHKKGRRMTIIVDSLRDLWDNIKDTNIRIKGFPEEEEEKKGSEEFF